MKYAAILTAHDLPQIETARRHQYAYESETHGNLVGHHLRRRTHRTEKGVLRIRGPAGDDDSVDAHRAQRQHVEQAGVDVGEDQPIGKRHHRPGRERRRQRQ